MKCTVETRSGGKIYGPSFMKIGTDVQAMLRFCLRNLRGCNIGITDGKELQSAPLRPALVARFMYQVE
jgi:hypothetical protein